MHLWLGAQEEISTAGTDIRGHVWAVVIVVAIFGGIITILQHRARTLRYLAILYVVALSAIQLLMRQLTRPPLGYRYPASVTVLHYLGAWTVAAAYWCAVGEPGKLLPSSAGSLRQYTVKMAPIALALPLSVALSNKALVYIGAGLAAVVGTLSPVTTAVVSQVMGRRLSITSWTGVAVAFVGAFLAGWMELQAILHTLPSSAHAMTVGILFALFALLLRSFRVVIQDTLLTPHAYRGKAALGGPPDVPLSGMHLLAVQSPAVVLVALAFAIITERPSAAWQHLTGPVVHIIIVTTVIAALVNVVGMFILKDLGSAPMQLVGKLNSILTIAVSLSFFGESLPVGVLIGSAIVLAGVAIFEKGEADGLVATARDACLPSKLG